MTIILELTPEEEALLKTRTQAQNTTPEAYVHRVVVADLERATRKVSRTVSTPKATKPRATLPRVTRYEGGVIGYTQGSRFTDEEVRAAVRKALGRS